MVDERLFDLLERIAEIMVEQGRREEATELRAHYARGTGGAEIMRLADLLTQRGRTSLSGER